MSSKEKKLKQEKVWPGVNCSVVERIYCTHTNEQDRSKEKSWSIIQGDCASLRGHTNSRSSLFDSEQLSCVHAIGREEHKYTVMVPEGCRITKCEVTVKCKASATATGALGDTDLTGILAADLLVCNENVPIRLELDAKKSPDEGKVETEKKGEAKVGSVNGSVSSKESYVKVVGGSGNVIMPTKIKETKLSCTGGGCSIEAVTTMSVSSYANDNNGDSVSGEILVENTIETQSVEVVCECGEPKVQKIHRDNEHNTEGSHLDSQEQIRTLIEQAQASRTKSQEEVNRIMHSITKADLELLKTLKKHAENVYFVDDIKNFESMKSEILPLHKQNQLRELFHAQTSLDWIDFNIIGLRGLLDLASKGHEVIPEEIKSFSSLPDPKKDRIEDRGNSGMDE